MLYDELLNVVIALPFDTPYEIYREGNISLFILRPSIVSKRYKHYDINKNFQIFMQEGNNKPFKPNHLRTLISLNLWVRNNPSIRKCLSLAFDEIFYGADPFAAIKNLSNYDCINGLNSLGIIAHLTQCFYVEQDYSFASKSNFDPPSLYLHGWVRTFINSDTSLDNLLWRMCKNTPPTEGYTKLDNKLSRYYQDSPPELWYL